MTWEVFERPYMRATPAAYISYPFDRKIFDPMRSYAERQTLYKLRQIGRARARRWDYNFAGSHHGSDHFYCCASNILQCLGAEFRERREGYQEESYLDIGCGDSPDALIAQAFGYHAYGLDLFQPDYWMPEVRESFFVCGDAAELPFADCSFDWITCNAMIALLPESDRMSFYREALRVLKIGGRFALAGVELKCGHGWRQGAERQRASRLKGWEVDSLWLGFRADKL